MTNEPPYSKSGGKPGGAVATREGLRQDTHHPLRQYEHRFHAGQTLVLQGDACGSVLHVLDGWLAVFKSLEDGQRQIIDFALPGEMIEPAAADETSSSVTVEALTEGSVAIVPWSEWERICCDRPDLQHRTHRLRAAAEARQAERMLRLGKGSAEMRIAYALLELALRSEPAQGRDAGAFYIPLTQQRLGDYLGLSSVHVCRTLRRLARKGIAETTDHMNIRLLDRDALAALADVDCAALRQEIIPSPAS